MQNKFTKERTNTLSRTDSKRSKKAIKAKERQATKRFIKGEFMDYVMGNWGHDGTCFYQP